MTEVQTDQDYTPADSTADSPPYVPKLHVMNYAPRLTHRRPNFRRSSSGRVMKSPSLRDEIKTLESLLPKYDKRIYTACDRLSLALSYVSYLEGLVAASSPDNEPVPKETVPLISEFNLYHLSDDKKDHVPDTTMESPEKVKCTNEIQVDQVDSKRKEEDNVTKDVTKDCSCEETGNYKDLDSNYPNLELFPELCQLPLQEIQVFSQDCRWHDVSWCCCPHREEQDELCKTLQNNRFPRDTSKMDLVYSKMMIKKRMNSPTKNEGEEKMKAKTKMTPGELKLEERTQYIRMVLSRMESAVKVARDCALFK